MEKEADTTEWNDLIVSVPDLCRLLHLRGVSTLRPTSEPNCFSEAKAK